MNTREAALQSTNLPKPMAIAARPISPPFLMWGFWDMAKSDPRTLEEYLDFLYLLHFDVLLRVDVFL